MSRISNPSHPHTSIIYNYRNSKQLANQTKRTPGGIESAHSTETRDTRTSSLIWDLQLLAPPAPPPSKTNSMVTRFEVWLPSGLVSQKEMDVTII